jgi:hypothetical protein
MQKWERFRLVAVIGLVVALMSAGFALAGDAFDTPADEPTTCEPIDDTVDDGDTVEEGEQSEQGDTGDEGESEEGDAVEGGDVSEDGDGSEEGCEEGDEGDTDDVTDDGEEGDELVDVEPALEVSEERVEECTEAAGLTPEDAPEAKPVPGEKTGLENAIAHVLWNCLGNDNDGLVNALDHLSWNLEQKELRDEAKEERQAEREAAKAEREAAHEAAKAERTAAHDAAKAARELSRSS